MRNITIGIDGYKIDLTDDELKIMIECLSFRHRELGHQVYQEKLVEADWRSKNKYLEDIENLIKKMHP